MQNDPLYESDRQAWSARQFDLIAAERFSELDVPNLMAIIGEMNEPERSESQRWLESILHKVVQLNHA